MATVQEKSTQELKAMAYDIVVAVQKYQNTLNAINQELEIRAQKESLSGLVTGMKAIPKDESPS